VLAELETFAFVVGIVLPEKRSTGDMGVTKDEAWSLGNDWVAAWNATILI
jgi:hypothetical protein